MINNTMKFIGNQKTVKLLDRIFQSGKIANAYLFLGPEGVGKFMLAKDFAEKLTGNIEKANPNLLLIRPEEETIKGIVKKRDIKVETIRELQHKLSLTASGAGYRAVVIDEAERLNKIAQNALLKTLEEPNEKVVLILVSQNENKILPTMVSRCQKIKFGLVSDEEMREISDKSEEIAFWSCGRPGIAKKILDDPAELEFRENTKKELEIITAGNISEKFALAESWSKDENKIYEKLNLWLILLRENLRGAKSSVSPDKALIFIEAISESMQILKDTNTNTRLVLENLFLKL